MPFLETPQRHDSGIIKPNGGVHSVGELQKRGFISHVTPALLKAEVAHPVAITATLLGLIQPEDPHDPLARQFVPQEEELESFSLAQPDPIGDAAHSPVRGIIHRYPDRLLFNPIVCCPAYCRFCFRRSKVGASAGLLSRKEIERAVDYIRGHEEVGEVILSGGEPLMLSPRRLRDIFRALEAIPHIKKLRIHTRAPITIPEQFSPGLMTVLSGTTKPLTMLIHCNHPRELGETARHVMAKLHSAGITLLSQSVLLKGVNDNLETLTELMRAFVDCGIKPHYLHHPDLVAGTRHFRLSLESGRALVQQLHEILPETHRPTYILDIPGGAGKVSILSDRVQKTEQGWLVENDKGEQFVYDDAD